MNRAADVSAAARAYRRGVVFVLLGSVSASWLGLGVRVMESATACFSTGDGLAISLHDTLWSLAMGVFQLDLALVLFTMGSRTVPAADMTLLAMTEVVLAPFWVWLVFGETAGVFTLIRGALLLAAVAADAITGVRDRKTNGGPQ